MHIIFRHGSEQQITGQSKKRECLLRAVPENILKSMIQWL